MFKARLYFNGVCTEEISISNPMGTIRKLTTRVRPQVFSRAPDPLDYNETMDKYIMVYDYVCQESYDTFRYEFSFQESMVSKTPDHNPRSLDIGFEPPPPNLSLDDFKKKMRQGVNLKNMLLNYMRKA